MTPTVLRRKLAFWQGQGLLRESTQEGAPADNHYIYTLVEERSGLRGGSHEMIGLMDIEEEAESAMASAQQQKEEEMQVRDGIETRILDNHRVLFVFSADTASDTC